MKGIKDGGFDHLFSAIPLPHKAIKMETTEVEMETTELRPGVVTLYWIDGKYVGRENGTMIYIQPPGNGRGLKNVRVEERNGDNITRKLDLWNVRYNGRHIGVIVGDADIQPEQMRHYHFVVDTDGVTPAKPYGELIQDPYKTVAEIQKALGAYRDGKIVNRKVLRI